MRLTDQQITAPDEQEINPNDDQRHLARARMRAWGTLMLIFLVCLGIAWALGAFRI